VRWHLLIVLVVLAGLTAFAPAPFPRPRRSSPTLDLNRLSARWKVAGMQRVAAQGKLVDHPWYITHILIQNGRWSFLDKTGRDVASYLLEVDPTKKPATITWLRNPGEVPTLVGIIRRKGKVVEILYLATTNRPASFEKPPEGYYLLTLKREG
jgi:uncharacterized protein (TIGR03067 family)